MSNLKIKAHTSFIGTTGYNNHAQSFFKTLSKYTPVEVRNFTVGKSWTNYSDEPHNGEPYLDNTLKTMLVQQSLWDHNKRLSDYPIYKKWHNPGKPDINLVLNETNHHYFYQDYQGYSIAYNVWESTLQPEAFFNRLLDFNELWVPSKWQRDCTVAQGYPADKIFVIPEGVDSDLFFPEEVSHPLTSNGRFTFSIFGRWDYRKSTKELIETFLSEFSKDEPVDLILSIDNPYSGDGLSSTEERLAHYNFTDDRLKVLHLPPREEYIKLLKSTNVFLSCARAEGWNLPLIEAMACGTPSIYSNCSAQLEFAEGKGLPVKIVGERPISESTYAHFNESIGNYYEPDFVDLAKVMRSAYTDWAKYKKEALSQAKEIHKNFNWDKIAKEAIDHINSRSEIINRVNLETAKPLNIGHHFVRGAHVELSGGDPNQYWVEFIDQSTGKVEHAGEISNSMWIKTSKQYFVDWLITVKEISSGDIIFSQKLDLSGKRVYISLDSKSLGDTLAWFPAVEEFRKKHNCKVICSTFQNDFFEKTYPEIEFIKPGDEVHNVKALYTLGWYYDEAGQLNPNMNPRETKNQAMQKSAFDILGLEYKEVPPKLNIKVENKKRQVAIAIHATCQAKYWNNPTGWQEVVDFCSANNYEVVLISREDSGFMGNIHPTGIRKLPSGPIEAAISEISKSEAFIGIGSGLSWLSWAIGTPTILISGFSHDYTEPLTNTTRICSPAGKCSGCFNTHRLDPSDWNWCPVHKGTDRQFECSKLITADSVISQLKKILGLV